MMTKLFSTCTGLFLFALFHGSLAFRTINQRKNGRLLRNGIIFKGSNKSSMRMHFGHDHNHDHEEDQHEDQQSYRILDKIPLSRWGEFLRPITFLSRTQGSVVVSAALVCCSALLRQKITRFDVGVFAVLTAIFSSFSSLKSTSKKWIFKIKNLQDSFLKHSTPLTRKYFFKNENAADRVTLLGVWINIVLSIAKFFGGLAFNSAVLVADAGHSLSDLVSDFITLWTVQIARLPPDEDHPYGHGKFESVGSLFLSLTLLATGISVGMWSYEKMHMVLTAQKLQALAMTAATAVTVTAPSSLSLPSWPALLLAGLSIASKEWLFRITKRVGEAMNSQILIANAWHHRSDAFSSVLSLASIALAILVPGLLVADSAAGIMVAGMICLTGMEILFESIKQLTDTSDKDLSTKLADATKSVDGVLGVKNIRSRTVGSSSLVDLTVLTDAKISASAAQIISEKVRWKILEVDPNVVDVMVRTQSTSKLCPLLSSQQKSTTEVEQLIRAELETRISPILSDLEAVKRVSVHFMNSALLCVDIVISARSSLSVANVKTLAQVISADLKSKFPDIVQADVQLDLGTTSAEDAAVGIARQ